MARRQPPQAPQALQHRQSSQDLGSQDAPGARLGKSTGPRAALASLAAAWAEAAPANHHRRTITRSIRAAFGLTPAEHVNPELLVTATIARWRAEKYATSTIHNMASELRGLCRWVDDLTGTKLARHKFTVPRGDPRATALTRDAAIHAISTAPPWLRCLLLLCYECGLRSGTAVQVAPLHYDRDRQCITIRTKRSQVVQKPISPQLAELMARHEGPPDEPYITALRGTHALTAARTPQNNYNLLDDAWRRHKKKAGIPPEITLHDIRRSLCVHTYTVTGGDLIACQQVLSHRDLSTTLRYLQPLVEDTARQRQILRQLHIPKGEIN
jgi:integrase